MAGFSKSAAGFFSEDFVHMLADRKVWSDRGWDTRGATANTAISVFLDTMDIILEEYFKIKLS